MYYFIFIYRYLCIQTCILYANRCFFRDSCNGHVRKCLCIYSRVLVICLICIIAFGYFLHADKWRIMALIILCTLVDACAFAFYWYLYCDDHMEGWTSNCSHTRTNVCATLECHAPTHPQCVRGTCNVCVIHTYNHFMKLIPSRGWVYILWVDIYNTYEIYIFMHIYIDITIVLFE